MYDFEILVDHENVVTISCFRTFLIFIQSYIFNFCIYFKCFFLYLYIYIYVCTKKIVIERTRDLIYLNFEATDFFPKIISPSAGENSSDSASIALAILQFLPC